MRDAWRSYLQTIARFAPALLSLTVLSALLAALLEGVGIMMLLPLLSLLDGHGVSGIPARSLRFMTSSAVSPLALALLLFVTAIGLRSLLVGAREYCVARLRLGLAHSLRQRLFDALCAADWGGIAGRRRSNLLHVLSEEVTRVDQGIQSLIQSAAAVFLIMVQLCVALLLSVKITLLVLAVTLLGLYFAGATLRRSLAAGALISSARERSIAAAADAFYALKQIKGQALERVLRDSFALQLRQIEEIQLHHVRANQLSDARYQLLAAGGLALTLWLTMERLHFGIARTTVLIVIFARLAPLLASLIQSCRQVMLALPACDHVLATTRELESLAVAPTAATQGLACPWQQIRFDDVSFRYGSGQPWILQHLHLCIRANSTTVVLGSSGSGKTTLIDLLAGLLRPSTGRLLVDGLTLQSLDPALWRGGLAYVVQDGLLWDMSIRDNLTFGLGDVDDAQLARALHWAGATEIVAAAEAGLESRTGERGERLSGGERQRLALARALLRHPRLLLLDEPSNSLDSQGVETLRRTLTTLRGQMTIVIATHDTRLTSLADQIVDLTEAPLRSSLAAVRAQAAVGGSSMDSR